MASVIGEIGIDQVPTVGSGPWRHGRPGV